MRLWEVIRLTYVNQHDNWRLIDDKDLNSHSYNKETKGKQDVRGVQIEKNDWDHVEKFLFL